MIKPKNITIKDIDGKERKFIISRFPATDGMEILYKLPTAAIPKIGDFDALKEARNDIFKFVYVETDGGELALKTKALIDNHTGDAETAIKVMKEIIEYNYSFFQSGILSNFLNKLSKRIPIIAQEILTRFSQQSSKRSKRR